MIIVTGANGFIGSALIWMLNERGIDDIVAVDRISPEKRHQLLEPLKYQKFISADEFLGQLPKISRDVKFVFHMGACSDTTEMDIEFLRRVNTDYTQTLFKWATEHSIPFIYASSGAVYGDGSLGFSEDIPADQLKPLNPYGESKRAFDEWVLKQTLTPPSWYGLRFFNVYGPNEYYKGDMASVVFKAFHQIQNSGQLKLFKSLNPNYRDGEQVRDFVYVKDVCRWMLELMDKHPKSGIYNMGYGHARTWLNLAENSFAALGKPLKINWIDLPDALRERYQYFTEARMDKWNETAMSAPQWDLSDGIHDYIQNYLLSPDPHLKAL